MQAPWPWFGDAAASAARRAALWALLGPRPLAAGPARGDCLGRSEHAGADLERWRLHLNGEQAVPALLLRPRGVPLRGLVLYCHAHGNRFEVGKDELLQGRPALQTPAYGAVLPALGFAVLAIDHWGFGERQVPSERALVKRLLWQGHTLWGWRVHDSLAALDWLRTQPGLHEAPVFTLGLSMGSTMAVWTAALDERIAGCIDLCCLAEYSALLADGSHDLHGEYFFAPRLLQHFSAAEVAALIAPRPHLSLAGRRDPLTPPAGLASLDAALRQADAALGQPGRWQQQLEDAGHQETPAMRAAVLAALTNWAERLALNARAPASRRP